MMQKFFFENGTLYSESKLSENMNEYIILIIFLHFYWK